MSGGAINEVTGRVVSAMRADPQLQSLCGNPLRIYEDVSADAAFPYISLGAPQDNPILTEGVDLSELFISFDAWSRSSAEECSAVISAIRNLLHNAARFDTANYSVCPFLHRTTRGPFRDPDGITWHCQITFRAAALALI